MEKEDNGAGDLLMTAFEEKRGLVETLEMLRYVSSSAQEGVPHVPASMLNHFVDAKAVKKRLEETAQEEGETAERASALLKVWWED